MHSRVVIPGIHKPSAIRHGAGMIPTPPAGP